jgi:2-iminobutanoate/2-iminopropanoate deaminase
MSDVHTLPLGFVAVACMAAAGCASPGMPTAAGRQVIASDNAPKAIGPYSQAIRAGDLMFLAGQIAIDPKSNQFIVGTIEEETALTLDNIKAVLAANGMTMANVVSSTVFMKDLNDFAKMNAVYATYFKEAPPARATVQVARIPRDAKVEIAVIAAK